MHRNFWSLLSVLLAIVAVPAVWAIEPAGRTKVDPAEEVETIELFQGMDEGRIEANFYPKDATVGTIILKNKGDKPVNVAVPKAFGAIHILPQMGMGGMGGMGGGMMGGMGGGMGGMGGGMGGMGGGMGGMGGGMGGGQGMGGGMGGGGMGGMGGGMGGMGGGMGGMFRVEPDKSKKIPVPCVCLEHGKTDPNPRMKYKLVPIERINNDPRVADLCGLLGYGQVPQNTAQATAWHLANGLSWDELMVKNRVESPYTGNIRYFHPMELQNAYQLSNLLIHANQQAESSAASSPGYNTSTAVSTAPATSATVAP